MEIPLDQLKQRKSNANIRARERLYDMPEGTLQALYELQDKHCALCNDRATLPNLMVDHDHATGIVRGLLCRRCNAVLHTGKDNRAWLEKAIQYIEDSPAGRKWRREVR